MEVHGLPNAHDSNDDGRSPDVFRRAAWLIDAWTGPPIQATVDTQADGNTLTVTDTHYGMSLSTTSAAMAATLATACMEAARHGRAIEAGDVDPPPDIPEGI